MNITKPVSDGVRETEPLPETCLSFEVFGPWGHFKRIDGNVVKRTYRIMPRTTVAGLIGAIIGLPRNSYYHLFQPENSAIAIEPTTELRTIDMGRNTLPTNTSELVSAEDRKPLKVAGTVEKRQQHVYEMLVDVGYRIDVTIADTDTYTELQRFLEQGKSVYTPSLGRSECIAEIEYLGEHSITPTAKQSVSEVESVVPNRSDSVIPEPRTSHRTERSPAFMVKDTQDPGFSERRTTGFAELTYRVNGNPVSVRDTPAYQVDNRMVAFT